jgi:hypothetical protein
LWYGFFMGFPTIFPTTRFMLILGIKKTVVSSSFNLL